MALAVPNVAAGAVGFRRFLDQVLGDHLPVSPWLQADYPPIPDLREPDLALRAADRSRTAARHTSRSPSRTARSSPRSPAAR